MKRKYNDRVMQVKQISFTPLVFTITGSMGTKCLQFYELLTEKISSKSVERYADVLNTYDVS